MVKKSGEDNLIGFVATYPVKTTKKSIMFQMFLRYEPLCKTKPRAKIFNDASTQKIPRKYGSDFSCKSSCN